MAVDELKKQKALESLSQEEQKAFQDPEFAQTMSRLLAGATPTLFGFFRSPAMAEQGIKQTKEFYKAGKPEKESTADSSGKWLTGKTWVTNSKGEEEIIDTLTNNVTGAVVNAYTKEPVIASRSYVKPSTFARKDIGGGTTIIESDITKKKDKVKTTPALAGPGQYYGVATEGQAKLIEKGIESGQKQAQELYEKEEGIKSTISSLKTNKDPRVLSQDIYGLARVAEAKDRLTEQDFKQLTGIDKETWFNRVKYAIDTGAFGDIEDLSKSFVPLAERILQKTQRQRAAIPSKFAPKSERAQQALKDVLPSAGMPESSQMTREQLIQMVKEKREKQGKR